MVRKPLDSIEYELTYLELRPESERLSDTMDPPVVAPRRRDERVDDAVAVYGIAAVDTDIRVVEAHTTPPLPADLHRMGGPAQAHAVQRVGLISRRPPSPRRLRSWTLLQLSVVALSTSLGPIAAFDARAAHALFVAITGVLILGWARLAWGGTPRAERFGAATTRLVDRLVTALGTFFAIALWTRYAPEASAGFARAGLLVLCGVGLVAVLLSASRTHRP